MNKRIIGLIAVGAILVNVFAGCSTKTVQVKTTAKETGKTSTAVNSNVNKSCMTQNDMIYFVMTDRFYNGDKSNDNGTNTDDPRAYHGGDLKGLTDKLDYIKSLGATAIWITPVVQNVPGGYHGYWTKDFYKVDEHLGSMEDLKNLVSEAHKKNIKILMDYVVNHVGGGNPWLTDGKHNGWFHPDVEIQNFDDPEECENGWLSGLPDLRQENPEVSDYLIKNALWWIDNTGIDGMRLDTVRHVPKSFWSKFTKTIKAKYPSFYFLGEIWNDNTTYQEEYKESGIDGVTDYNLYDGLKNTFKEDGSTSSLVAAIGAEKVFINPELNGMFIDNHDNKRFVTYAGNNGDKYLKLAMAFELTYPEIPIIYYGTEIGMEGGDDPDNRRDMEWNKTSSSDILSYYKNMVKIRNDNNEFKSKDIKVLDYGSDYFAYTRGTGKDKIVIVMNIQNGKTKVDLKIDDAAAEYVDLLSNSSIKCSGGTMHLNMNPISCMILKAK